MKTLDVRLLLADDVDDELLIRQLITVTSGPGAPLGACSLESDGTLITRAGVTWAGEPRDDAR